MAAEARETGCILRECVHACTALRRCRLLCMLHAGGRRGPLPAAAVTSGSGPEGVSDVRKRSTAVLAVTAEHLHL